MTTVAKAFLDIRGTGQRREEEAGETCVAQEMPFSAKHDAILQYR